ASQLQLRRFQAIPASTECGDGGFLTSPAELFAEIGDVRFDHVGVMLPVVVIEMLEQLARGDDGAWAEDEVFEQPILSGREIDELAGAANGLLYRVERDASNGELRVGRAFAAANKRLRSRDQLTEVEGFGQVIVRSGIEQLDNGGALVARSQYKNGSLVTAAANAANDTEAVETGQHQIEQQQVVVLKFGHGGTVGAVFGRVDGEAAALAQRLGDVVGQPGFVLHHEHSHEQEFTLFPASLRCR